MDKPKLDLNNMIQIAIVVKDIEKAAKAWSEMFGVEMPEITPVPPPDVCQIYYRGKKTATRAKLACIKAGQITIELTEPDEMDSSWKEYLDEHGQGVHHLGFTVGSDENRDKIIRLFEDNDMEVRHYGYYPGGSYTFVNTEDELGVNLNIKPHE